MDQDVTHQLHLSLLDETTAAAAACHVCVSSEQIHGHHINKPLPTKPNMKYACQNKKTKSLEAAMTIKMEKVDMSWCIAAVRQHDSCGPEQPPFRLTSNLKLTNSCLLSLCILLTSSHCDGGFSPSAVQIGQCNSKTQLIFHH